MKIHKLTWVLLIGLLLLSSCSAKQPDVYLSAQSAAVFSVENGKMLYEKNADKVMPIASLTKLMTAFLVLEAVDNKNYRGTSNLISFGSMIPLRFHFTLLRKKERGRSGIYIAQCSSCLQMMLPRR